MARVAKSLTPPEQGYPHRDHRMQRVPNQPAKRHFRIVKQKVVKRIQKRHHDELVQESLADMLYLFPEEYLQDIDPPDEEDPR